MNQNKLQAKYPDLTPDFMGAVVKCPHPLLAAHWRFCSAGLLLVRL
jgi:hypothetical protein